MKSTQVFTALRAAGLDRNRFLKKTCCRSIQISIMRVKEVAIVPALEFLSIDSGEI